MSEKNKIFIKLLKEYTNINKKFIDTFFKKFEIGHELEFDIIDEKAAKYLGIELVTLRKRLLNRYSKSINYVENVDYVKAKAEKGPDVTYMLNYQCFERLAMNGDSKESDVIRSYFIKLRKFLTEYQHIFYQSLTNRDELRKFKGFESIYFFASDHNKSNIFKLGRTMDIIKRLRTYNTGRIKEVDLEYFAIVTNSDLIENCIGDKLEKKQVIKDREIYSINPKSLRKIIEDCYCKNVPKEAHEELYSDLAGLIGLYGHVQKSKKNIQPYIVINKPGKI